MAERILVIDDEEQDRKGMSIALKKYGYNDISTASTAGEGLEMAKNLKPDVVVVDIVLKNINGFDVCRNLKAAKGVKPLVIMITSHLDAINGEKARHSGADEILEKRPGFPGLGETVRKTLKK